MTEQEQINYQRIAKAINYIQANFKKQPELNEIAKNIHLSPFHFQRLFTEWAGTSPKKFLQYISLGYAKKLLKNDNLTIADAAYETGLSGTSRLHDLFIKIEGMSPAEYKNGAADLNIHYNFLFSPFGKLIVASTEKGICYMSFVEDDVATLNALYSLFPHAKFIHKSDRFQNDILNIFSSAKQKFPLIKLHIKGSDFQLKVWETLLKIPLGSLTSYGTIAARTGNPYSSRAVGTAIARNPVALLIPCHRVIRSSGILGEYMWGSSRKTAIIAWEASKIEQDKFLANTI